MNILVVHVCMCVGEGGGGEGIRGQKDNYALHDSLQACLTTPLGIQFFFNRLNLQIELSKQGLTRL